MDKIYLSDLTAYNKVLKQRNSLLKDMIYHPDLKDTLPIWDEQLVEYGKRIIRRRQSFIEELYEIVQEIHGNLSGKRELLTLKYEPNVESIFFQDELFRASERDRKLCQTSVGPHRDDISTYFFTSCAIPLCPSAPGSSEVITT